MKAWLAAMDMDVHDAALVFDLVDDGDSSMSMDELVRGFARLKGAARSLDLATVIRDNRRINGTLKRICEKLHVNLDGVHAGNIHTRSTLVGVQRVSYQS